MLVPAFSNLKKFNSLRIPLPESEIRHAWYRFYVYIEPEYISEHWTRERIINEKKPLNLLMYFSIRLTGLRITNVLNH